MNLCTFLQAVTIQIHIRVVNKTATIIVMLVIILTIVLYKYLYIENIKLKYCKKIEYYNRLLR